MSRGLNLDSPLSKHRISELLSRQSELIEKVTSDTIDAGLAPLLRNTVWGRIEWPRRIGRPVTPTLWQGFTFTHMGKQEELDQQTGRMVQIDVPKDMPSAWDDMTDEGTFRVNFWAMSSQVGQLPNSIAVDFAPGTIWSRPAPGTYRERGIRVLTPRVQSYSTYEGGPVVLGSFTVRIRPFLFLGR